MQSKIMQGSPSSFEESEMAGSESSVHQSNILFPHQVGSLDSTCSSWPGRVWQREPSKYWLDSDSNNNNNNNIHHSRDHIMRLSCSSDCSDISNDDVSSLSSDESEDSDNNNYNNTTSSSSSPQGISVPGISKEIEIPSLLAQHCMKEDQNNNIHQNVNNNNTSMEDTKANHINTDSTWTKNSTKSKSDNPSRERLLDDEGYIRRAACVCLDETESKVLLVSSKKDPCSWLVPGGGMEAGEEMATAAIREAWEEAGVQGHITKYLGLFETKHHSGSKKHRTAVFVVSVKRVMADYPEAYLGRGRQWFTLEDALLHLATTRPMQSAYLQLLLVSRLKVSAA